MALCEQMPRQLRESQSCNVVRIQILYLDPGFMISLPPIQSWGHFFTFLNVSSLIYKIRVVFIKSVRSLLRVLGSISVENTSMEPGIYHHRVKLCVMRLAPKAFKNNRFGLLFCAWE